MTSDNHFYNRLGVKRIINGHSWVTVLGGSLMAEPVKEAMVEASQWFVDMHDLNRKAGDVIAEFCGADSGLVTAGSASGMMLEAAACMTGTDPAKVDALPHTEGLKNEIVIHRAHRVSYDHAFRSAGARLVEIGKPGVTHEWELEAAIGENTAAIAYIFGPPQRGAIPLSRAAEIAHARGVPVVVDAAAMLPPQENLTKYLRQGADMVSFSGGKGVQGPQSTGILAGRKDLMEAAYLNAAPNAGIGRNAKVCKEEIAGLVTALQMFVDTDFDAVYAGWRRIAQTVVDALRDVPGISAEVVQADHSREEFRFMSDRAVIRFDQVPDGWDVAKLNEELKAGNPSIVLWPNTYEDSLDVYAVTLQEGEPEIIADRIREILTS